MISYRSSGYGRIDVSVRSLSYYGYSDWTLRFQEPRTQACYAPGAYANPLIGFKKAGSAWSVPGARPFPSGSPSDHGAGLLQESVLVNLRNVNPLAVALPDPHHIAVDFASLAVGEGLLDLNVRGGDGQLVFLS